MSIFLKSPIKKADNGNRTRLSSLGSWRSTDELYLQAKIVYHKTRKRQEFFRKLSRLHNCNDFSLRQSEIFHFCRRLIFVSGHSV